MAGKMRVLFICTGNSCRSQMAEGLINHDFKNDVVAQSAGIIPGVVNANAIEVMSEIGIDISKQRSKHISEFQNEKFDLIITLCDYAASNCPIWPHEGEKIHIPFDDPINYQGTEEEVLKEYSRIRDLIRREIGIFLRDRVKGRVLDAGGHC